MLIINWEFEWIANLIVVSGLLSMCNAVTTIVVLEVVSVFLSLTVIR